MEANWPMAVLMIFVTGVGVYIGRVWLKRWFNPLSIYSAIWGFCLFNYELQLVQYYPIRTAAWMYIAIAWIGLYFGAGAVLLLTSPRVRQPSAIRLPVDLVRLKKGILILSVVGTAGVIGQVIDVMRSFGGGIGSILLNANEIYVARISNQLSGLPYAGAFSLAACVLAGVHVAKSGKFTFATFIPIVLVSLQLLFLMGRGALGLAAVLFLASAVHTPRDPGARTPKWQRIAAIVLIATMLGGVFVVVSSVRGLGVNYPGITPAMDRISEYIPFAPSLYSNFSATPVAFSMYLSSPDESKHGFFGMYTFAPIFRVLSRLGFRTAVPPYEENYWTPIPMNGSTYLKNLYSDFGPAGIVIFPFVLGVVTTALILRIRATPRLLDVVVLTNIYVIVVFSFGFDFMLSGDWYIGLVTSVLTAFVVDQQAAKARQRERRGLLRQQPLRSSEERI
jgi:oligosaccharide repeat unit polymerase